LDLLSSFLELKQLNEISRGIFQKPGATGSALADFTFELGSSIAQPPNERVDVIGDEHEPIPSAGLWLAASTASTACTRSAQVEREVVMSERRELARRVHFNFEFEPIAIELERTIDIAYDVADGCHCGPSLQMFLAIAIVGVAMTS
jgi:hypothetical protein